MTPFEQAESVGIATGWRTLYQAFDNSFRAFSPTYELDGVSVEAPSAQGLLRRIRTLLTAWSPPATITVTTPVAATGR